MRALAGDALDEALPLGERMPAPGCLVPTHERVVGRIEEHDPRAGPARPEFVERPVECVHEQTRPHVDHEHVARHAFTAAREVGHLADERRRQVVDDEEPDVLERVGGR